ncbi:hypothetical protein JOQ06_012944, partial [Pogonophryne albipinna]
SFSEAAAEVQDENRLKGGLSQQRSSCWHGNGCLCEWRLLYLGRSEGSRCLPVQQDPVRLLNKQAFTRYPPSDLTWVAFRWYGGSWRLSQSASFHLQCPGLSEGLGFTSKGTVCAAADNTLYPKAVASFSRAPTRTLRSQ